MMAVNVNNYTQNRVQVLCLVFLIEAFPEATINTIFLGLYKLKS